MLTFNDTMEIHLPNGETYGHAFSLDEGNIPRKWDNTDEIIPNTGFVEWDDNHIRFKLFSAIKKDEDADRMGSASKVIVLAS